MAPLTRLNIPVDELGLDQESLRNSFVNHIQHTQGKHPRAATELDKFNSLARTVRDRLFDRWTRTWQRRVVSRPKHVYYLSLEFLIGRLAGDSMHSLGIHQAVDGALTDLNLDLGELLDQERDPGLGNGGLGRLAACFMDSLATLGMPAMGYGLRYDYGIFRQDIVDGEQWENPDLWLQFGSPWEVPRPERIYDVHFGGRVIHYTRSDGETVHEWVDTTPVRAMAHDVPIPGYGNGVVNTLRLWSAKATRDFDIHYFNRGDYAKAVERQSIDENITRVLYPNDNFPAGKELRLKQQYFLVSATLQDAVRRHLTLFDNLENFADQVVLQLNDTHPTLSIAELMRLLVDVHGYTWERAWGMTRASINYTNHTLLPEALERWPVHLMERLLPRHLQIIYAINEAFLDEVRAESPGDDERVRRMSIIEEGAEKQVRMGNLAVVGSSRVNGVSALHSDLIKSQLFQDFAARDPQKFTNQTNGVTPRRWLLKCNPELATLITDTIGSGWITNLSQLSELTSWADNESFQKEWRAIKQRNKQRLAKRLFREYAIDINPEFMLDSHVKRIHEYKRQLLNILHVISLYLGYRSGQLTCKVPQTFLFSGKAAPGYDAAKRIIHLISSVAQVVAEDRRMHDKLSVVFVPNYNVTWAESIIPATEVSEQISTAGMEASGTGNMKFALNGALTIGTLDGANIEIKDAVGDHNIFIFGQTAEEVAHTRATGYAPREIYYRERPLRAAIDTISQGVFSPEDPRRFHGLVDSLLGSDYYLILADFQSYANCRRSLAECYMTPTDWTRKSILNVANMGPFSSDRTIQGYASEIWGIEPDIT